MAAQEELRIVLEAETEKAEAAIKQASAVMSKDLTQASNKASKSIATLNKSVANANPTLVNFGRVIQDAPFGIIGIANNIDPLINSFQSLKQQTGSTGSAFKALRASLIGPAGIAIGISAVTSLLVAFGPQIADAVSGVSKLERTFIQAGEEGAKAFKETQIQVDTLLNTLNSSEASLLQQRKAFEGLNQILGAYGLQINSISDAQKIGSQVGAIYAQIKQNEAQATALAAAASEEYVKSLQAQNFVTNETSKLVSGNIFEKLLFFANPQAIASLGTATNKLQSYGDTASSIENEIKKLNDANILLINSLDKLPGVNERVAKSTRAVTQAIKAQNAELSITRQLQSLVSGGDGGGLLRQLQFNQANATGGGAPAQFEATTSAAIKAALAINENNRQLEESRIISEQAAAAYSLLAPAIDTVFNALSADDPFKALIDGVKQLIVQLIKAVAQAIILNAIINALSSGGGGFFSGVGKLLGGRAAGGFVGGGTPYVVGEAGPELFVPQSNGAIVPNMAMGGGGTLTARVAGNDLLFILNQAQGNKRRNFA